MFTVKETKEGYSVFLERDILPNGKPKTNARPVTSFNHLKHKKRTQKAEERIWKAHKILEERYGSWT